MSDTANLRRRGVPTVTLCWDGFASVARMHARLLGIDDTPLCVYPARRPDAPDTQDVEHVAVVARILASSLAPYFEVVERVEENAGESCEDRP